MDYLTDGKTKVFHVVLVDLKITLWHQVAYRWLLIHRPKIGLIRLRCSARHISDSLVFQWVLESVPCGSAIFISPRIFKGTKVVADSGNQFDDTLRGGGRLGVFCFSQEQLIWSDLSYTCRQRVPQQVYDELPSDKQNQVWLFSMTTSNSVQVEADPALPWRSTSNSVRWDDKADDKQKTRSGSS